MFPEHEKCTHAVIYEVLQQLKSHHHAITIDELSKICWDKIERLHLHKIIPLICEIKFIRLFKDTLELLGSENEESWKKIDPLQFLVALLHGHWGKNSLTDIRTWATYHLTQITANATKDDIVHKYKLCCMCFVLLFEGSSVQFVEPTEKNYKIIVCTKEDNEWVNISDKFSQQSLKFLPDPCDSFPAKGKLAGWVDLLQHCKYEAECVKLYKKVNNEWTIRNNYRMNIKNLHQPRNNLQQPRDNQYHYKYEELLLCLGALSDGVLHGHKIIKDKTLRQDCYNAKLFHNEDNTESGFMQCFDRQYILHSMSIQELQNDLSYTEIKLILNGENILKKQWTTQLLSSYQKDQWPEMETVANNDTLHKAIESSKNHKIISACRFVFAQFLMPITQTNKEVKGILFYTDSHYGQNWIEFNETKLQSIADDCTDSPECHKKTEIEKLLEQKKQDNVSEDTVLKAVRKLCIPCRYRMQKIIIEDPGMNEFPFIKAGLLTLKYDLSGTAKLIDGNLEMCS